MDYTVTYKKELQRAMEMIGNNDRAIFIGYNVKYGSRANGTLTNINEDQLIETPVAENLMVGLAIGMSLENYIPIVFFERFDFILNAMDAIINHLDKIKELSEGKFEPKVIIRVVVGNKKKPLFSGATHNQNFIKAMRFLVNMKIEELTHENEIFSIYKSALNSKHSSIIIEYKDLY